MGRKTNEEHEKDFDEEKCQLTTAKLEAGGAEARESIGKFGMKRNWNKLRINLTRIKVE